MFDLIKRLQDGADTPQARDLCWEAATFLTGLTAPSHGRDAGEVAKRIFPYTTFITVSPGVCDDVRADITAAILSERAEAEKMRAVLQAAPRPVANDFEIIPYMDWWFGPRLTAVRALASPSPAGKEQADG